MAKPAVFVLHSLCVVSMCVSLPYIQSGGCQYEGRAYKEGQDIHLADPCVKCNCVRGSLVCRLRVCAPQPLPPPPGCWLLRRRNDCCHKLVCSREMESGRSGSRGQIPEGVKDGCVVNGTVYAEGSAMDTSSLCQYCYCIKGQQHCVKPECLLTEPGCSPVYNSQSCCPTKYNCSAAINNTSTTIPPVLEHGCLVNGKYYPEGEMITSLRNNCENCYCMKNKVRCEPIICSVPLNQKCTPVITNGHCCPISYNCNPDESENTNGIDKKKQEAHNASTTWNLPMLNINKYLSSPALSSERSITDSSILSTGNVTLSTITKLDTQNTLQTSEGNVLSSDASIKNTTISKPSTGNTTSKTTTENALLKPNTNNATISKVSTENTALPKVTTGNTTISNLDNNKNATIANPIIKNATVSKPVIKNVMVSKPNIANATMSKTRTENITSSKPSTVNITKTKISAENITVVNLTAEKTAASKPNVKNTTESKINIENSTKSKPSTANVTVSNLTTKNATITKLTTDNTTNLNMSKPSTENTTIKVKPSSENTKLSKPSSANMTESLTATKPITHNTTKSESSIGNTTNLNTTTKSGEPKPSTDNTTLSKTSTENTTMSIKEVLTTTSSTSTVTEATTETESAETASMTTMTSVEETTITTTTMGSPETTVVVVTTIGVEGFNDTENRVAPPGSDDDEEEITTIKAEEYTTTVSHAETTLAPSTVAGLNQTNEVQKKTGISDPIRKIPSELEAILNKTREKDEDYEYDYNEPSLPPSLPNLRIIPFVAADAVVDDPDDSVYTPSQDKMLPTDSPHFYDVSHSNRFSPPIETEGGFVPKEPILDGPFYESKYDAPYHTTGLNSLPVDITSGTILPPITEPPKLSGNEQCLSGGHHYRHGELLTEPTACDLCLCFYGEILCQEPKCPPVKPGCRRIRERERGSCCGKIICGVSETESPTRVVDHVTPLTQTLQNSGPHLPAFTVADVIVTPDPFRDVIRTEPAPDLPSLIGEIMPYFWEHTTVASLTPIVHTRTTSRPVTTTASVSVINITHSKPTSTVDKVTHVSTNQLNDSTVKLSKYKNVTLATDHKTELNILKKKDEVDKNSYENGNDNSDNEDNENEEDDSFSFDSVFHYLFSGEPLTKSPQQVTTSRTHTKTQNVTTMLDMKNKTQKINKTEESLEHRSEEDSNSVLDYIYNTTSVPSPFAEKTTLLENYEKIEDLDDTKNANSIDKDTITTNQSHATVQIVQHTTQKYSIKSTTRKHYGTKQSTLTSRTTTVKPSHFPPLSIPDPGAVSGLLKLAGCNIYGRMYRVGRIISELSGPCLECMCTEVGVQCRPLKC